MRKQKVLFLCPIERDLYHLASSKISGRFEILFFGEYLDNPAFFDVRGFLTGAKDKIEKISDLKGIIGAGDYPESILASHLAQAFQLPGPSPESVFLCQHKYYSRIKQQDLVPEVVPEFFVIPLNHPLPPQEIPLSFPFFVKPVKGVLSLFSRSVDSYMDLESIIAEAQRHLPPFAKAFNDLLKATGLWEKFSLGGDNLIAEAVLSGHQVTLEGYVFAGDIQLIDIVDSIFYPDTRSFERFQCPSALPQKIQDQMFAIVQRVIKNIGFDNCIFNFEFIYDPDKKNFYILEINSRMAHQFAGMMEAIHGTNTYEIAVDIAAGQRPSFRRFNGNDRFAASYVLRTFEDLWIESTPTLAGMAAIQREFPKAHIENLIKPGRRLSDHFRQDTESYRYAIINLSANNEESLQNQFQQIKESLAYRFVK